MSQTRISLAALQRSCAARPLNQLFLPLSLAPQDLGRLDPLIPAWRLDTDEFLFREGERLSALYVLQTGSLELHVEDSGGRRKVMGFYFPGDVLGADALRNGRHGAACIALEAASVSVVPVYRLEEICALVPNLGEQIRSLMRGDIDHEHRRLLRLGDLNEEQRLATVLLSLSRRQDRFGRSRTRLNLPMTRHQMAAYLGSSPASLGRAVAKLRDAGLLSVQGRAIHLLDIPCLTDLSGEEPLSAPHMIISTGGPAPSAGAVFASPAHPPAAEQELPQPSTLGQAVCHGLDTFAGCAMATAAVAIAVFYAHSDDSLQPELLRAFYGAFTAGVLCFGAARILELLGLAYSHARKAHPAAPPPPKRESQTAPGASHRVGSIATQRHL